MKKEFDVEALQRMETYLKEKEVVDFENSTNAVLQRGRGKSFSFAEHLRALIYALLTNQRKWIEVVPKLSQIDRLFFQYDADKIKKHDGTYFEQGIRKLKCGNISIGRQMAGLQDDISVFELFTRKYGSMDAFVTSIPAEKIVNMLSDSSSPYKLRGVGTALAWEYLRNVGIDASKPDKHLRIFFGSERMAVSDLPEASEDEVTQEINNLAAAGKYNRFEIDYLIWTYCASGYGEVCTSSPKCQECVIQEYCTRRSEANYNSVNNGNKAQNDNTRTVRNSRPQSRLPDQRHPESTSNMPQEDKSTTPPASIMLSLTGKSRDIVKSLYKYMQIKGIRFQDKMNGLDDSSPYMVMNGGSGIGYRKTCRKFPEKGIVFFCTEQDKCAIRDDLHLKAYDNSDLSRPYAMFIPEALLDQAIEDLKKNPQNI